MGLDLTLLPFDPWLSFSHTVLSCERSAMLFCKINDVEEEVGECIPLSFSCHLGRDKEGNTAYGPVSTTPYGHFLRHVPAGSLVAINEFRVAPNRKNRAIWAYLSTLEPETRVALFWH